jgi:undecaprenyl phosphate N,N'-diacetylbacillosamine 1-phosphate transferase
VYSSYLKPLVDFVVAILALVILSPIMILLIMLLAIFQRGQVFFVQPRVGLHDQIFKIIKFKTMNESKDSEGRLLSDDRRLTWIGKFVRKTSLDELPQLFNILKGDMSFVGPRPLLVDYLPLYNKAQRIRHTVKPGITGWAQVNGRNAISWQERFDLDRWYVEHRSFLTDLKILYLTVFKVLRAEGISAQGMQTMEKFKGN